MNFRGVFPALITPFDANGNINCAAIEALVEWHLSCGVNGFYICGTSGEGMLLTDEERNLVARTVVRAVKDKASVIVHVGALSTRQAGGLATAAEDLGADAVSSVPPIFFGQGNQKSLIRHYEGIARASNLPLLVYYLPSHMGQLPMKAIQQVLDIDNVAGIKFSSYDLFTMRRIIEDNGNKAVLSGNDEVFFPALTMGAWGSIGLTLNFMPQLYVAIYKAFHSGNMAEGIRLQGCVNKVIETVLDIYAPAAAKTVLNRMGFDVGIPRDPLRQFDESERSEFFRRMEQANLFSMVGRG